jgi:hypothetical protein
MLNDQIDRVEVFPGERCILSGASDDHEQASDLAVGQMAFLPLFDGRTKLDEPRRLGVSPAL